MAGLLIFGVICIITPCFKSCFFLSEIIGIGCGHAATMY